MNKLHFAWQLVWNDIISVSFGSCITC